MRVAIIGQEIAALYDERGDLAQFFLEQFFVADTPCQSPHPGGLSAAGFEDAVRASYEMNGEGGPIINPCARFKRRVYAYELHLFSRLILPGACETLLPRRRRASQRCDECYDELYSLDSVLILHCFESVFRLSARSIRR